MAFTAPQPPLPARQQQQQHAPPSRGRGGSPIPSARVPHSASFSSISTLDAASSEEIPTPDFYRRSLLPHLPQAISHFLGHRPPHRTRFALPTAFTTAWHTLGAFLSILAVAGTMIQLYGFDDATVVGSIGAAATLLFLAPSSPLAQPRHMFPSQLLAATVGIGLSRSIPLNLHWLATALSVGLTALLMQVTHCVYPPAGATAVLAVLDGRWGFVGRVMVSTAVVAAVGCLWVNLPGISKWEGNRWPVWWVWQDEVNAPEKGQGLVITRDGVMVGEGLEVSVEERWVLEKLWERMRLLEKENV